jgi:hypothetical protein
MARWQAVLTGHSFDLEDLPGFFTAPALRVIEQDGTFLLEAEQFEVLTESAAVHAAAVTLLPIINGVAKLKSPSFRPVEVGSIRELRGDGTTNQHVVVLAGTIELRSTVSAVVIKSGEEEPPPPAPGSLDSDQWMRGASANPDVSRALAIWGGWHDPANLWKVWELVRDCSGLGIDPDLKRRFLPSTNDKTIAGEAARHEVPMRFYPAEPDTMTLPEAEAFLGDLLRQWFQALV